MLRARSTSFLPWHRVQLSVSNSCGGIRVRVAWPPRLHVRLRAVVVRVSDVFDGVWLARYRLQNSSETCREDGPVATFSFKVRNSGGEYVVVRLDMLQQYTGSFLLRQASERVW